MIDIASKRFFCDQIGPVPQALVNDFGGWGRAREGSQLACAAPEVPVVNLPEGILADASKGNYSKPRDDHPTGIFHVPLRS